MIHLPNSYMGNKSVPILATLVLFSYSKLFRNIITALSNSTLHMPQGSKAVWSADGNVDYLGPKHTPLFVTAVTLLFFAWLPYTLLLFLGRWLHKCNSRLINKPLIMMKPFLDAHYGPLKGKHHSVLVWSFANSASHYSSDISTNSC